MALFLLAAQCAFAASDRVGKTDIGFNASGAIPTDGNIDNAVYLGGSISEGVTDWIALGFEGGWAGFSESDSGIDVDENAFPMFGDIIVRIPNQNDWKPYGVVGLGAIFWDVKSNVSNVDVKIDTGFAAKFGGGVDWFVNENWMVNFEASYVISNSNVSATNTTTGASITVDSDTDYWMVGGGIKYLFS